MEQKPSEQQDHILQFFGYQHLPERVQAVSRPFCELAKALTDPAQPEHVPRNPERTVALAQAAGGEGRCGEGRDSEVAEAAP